MPSLLDWLKTFWPAPLPVSLRERTLSGIGALLGLLATEIVSRSVLGASIPWFVAPMGASAVLLFAVPASPLAQPWSIVGGNLLAVDGLRTTLSVGIAIADDGGRDLTAWLHAADHAMYQSKRAGRDRATVSAGPVEPSGALRRAG